MRAGVFCFEVGLMSYPPLSDARETLKPRWYRSPMPPETFRALSRRSDAKGWMQAGGHLAVFIATGALAWVFWAQGLWVLFFIALFVHGTVASFFSGTAPHELGHGTVFQTKWLNRAFLYLFSLIGWWEPLRLCQFAYLPPPLHAAPGWGPGKTSCRCIPLSGALFCCRCSPSTSSPSPGGPSARAG